MWAAAGDYSPASYLICKAVLDGLLLRAIPSFLYAAPFYPMVSSLATPRTSKMVIGQFSL